MRDRDRTLFGQALQLELPRRGDDVKHAGKLMEANDIGALDKNQRYWYRGCVNMADRSLPPFDGRKTEKDANTEHRRAARLAKALSKDTRVDRSVRDAATWMVNTLNEMKLQLDRAVYVFESSLYPGVLKIGSADLVERRVRAQLHPGEVITVVRTYKNLWDVESLEKKGFHKHANLELLRRTVGKRTECFTATLAIVDAVAEDLGCYIYPQNLVIS